MALIVNGRHIDFSAFRQIVGLGLDREFELEILSFLENWFDPELDSIEMKTSGSTGQPKSIVLSKKCMIQSAKRTEKYFGFKARDTAVLCLPVKYIAGKMMLVRALVSELDLILVNPASNPLESIQMHIDFIALTPHQMHRILDESPQKIRDTKNILLGGGPVSKQLLQRISRLKVNCFHSYGMTETASHVALRRINGVAADAGFHALEGINFRQDDHSCLVIEGDGALGVLHTTDVVELLNPKCFVWKGRLDNIINSGGIKISPEHMEAALSAMIDKPFLISYVEDDMLGQKLILIIESPENSFPDNIDTIMLDYKRKHNLPVPELVFRLDNFVYSASGKILRGASRELALSTSNQVINKKP